MSTAREMNELEKQLFSDVIGIKSLVGFADKLIAFGWRDEDVVQINKTMRCDDVDWSEVLKVVHGQAQINVIHHVIDMSVRPKYLGVEIIEHNRRENFNFETQELRLFLTDTQLNGGYMYADEFRNIRQNQKAANASVANYLIKYPHLISSAWKEVGGIIFPETVFRNSQGDFSILIKWRSISEQWIYDKLYVSENLFTGLDPDYPIAIIADKIATP